MFDGLLEERDVEKTEVAVNERECERLCYESRLVVGICAVIFSVGELSGYRGKEPTDYLNRYGVHERRDVSAHIYSRPPDLNRDDLAK